jgi:hypothetical protein
MILKYIHIELEEQHVEKWLELQLLLLMKMKLKNLKN